MYTKLNITLFTIIWLLILALWYCYYSHSNSQFPWWNYRWAGQEFSSWSWFWPRWGRMWSWMINNFSPEQKTIIDDLKKARENWDTAKEKELMDKLRNTRNQK